MFTPPKNPTVAPLNPLSRAAGEAWEAASDAALAAKAAAGLAYHALLRDWTPENMAAYRAANEQEVATWAAVDAAYGRWMMVLEQENAAANCTRIAA